MSDEIAISVDQLSKCFEIYAQPKDRLAQLIYPRISTLVGRQPKQYYQEFWALRDVSFKVRKGETVGILGRNGSGKSTLLQIICGTLNPTKGNLHVNGRIAALLELGSGFNPAFTGRENVYMNGAVLGLSKEEIDAKYASILEFADIGLFIDQPVKTYSSGMVVRLAFAVSVHVEPEVLIVDEALAVGDELFQRKCFSKIESLKQRGATILFVSHSVTTILSLCDSAILLDQGEIISIGTAKSVVTKYQKLLSAPEHKKEAVRKEIIIASSQKNHAESTDQPNQEEQLPSDKNEALEEFNLHLIPQSTVAYDERGAVIQHPKILNVEGDQVNNLVQGKTYIFSYQVHFWEHQTHVRFGMGLKTTTGQILGGGASAKARKNTIPLIEAGSTANVQFHFTCNLNPSVYYLNAGVMAVKNGEEVFLHRIVDVAVFRVNSTDNPYSTGIFNFNIYPEIHLDPGTQDGTIE